MELKYKRGDVCNYKGVNVVVIGSCFGRVDQEFTTVCRFDFPYMGDYVNVKGKTFLIKGMEHKLLSKLPEKKKEEIPVPAPIGVKKRKARVVTVEGGEIKE